MDSFRFNVAVAKVMEMVNVTRKAIDSGPGPADPAVREAAEAVAIVLSLVAPYTAEDMWARLGHEPSVALAGWPAGRSRNWSAAQTVTCVVQIAGKVKARLEVDPDIDEDELQALALADPAIAAALDGRATAPGDRAGAEAGQHRPRLIERFGCAPRFRAPGERVSHW